jgi:hypothetical protein
VPIRRLPTLEEDEARIASLAQARESRNEPVAATVSELVWRLITGAGNAPGLGILAESMSEMEKIKHFESLRLTDKQAAMRFADAVNIKFVRTQIIYSTLDNPRIKINRMSPVTHAIMNAFTAAENLDAVRYIEYLAEQSGKINPYGHSIYVLVENPDESPWAHRYEAFVSPIGGLRVGVMSDTRIQ